MLSDHLVATALDRQNQVAIVLLPTAPGEPPRIAEVNSAFFRLSGYPRSRVGGELLTMLNGAAALTAQWHQLLQAIAAGESLSGEVQCLTATGAPFLFGFRLSHIDDYQSGREHPVIIGRNATAHRWRVPEQESGDALIAAAFQKIDAPVLLLRQDGRIIATNLALISLIGYSAAYLYGRHIRELIHPGEAVSLTLPDTGLKPHPAGLRVRLMPRTKSGQAVPVWLTSALVETPVFGQVYVVTMLPEPTEAAPSGRVESVSLDALRIACGEEWEKKAPRLVMMANSIIKQRIGPRDVFARSAEHEFAIWFASGDERETASRVSAITREIRIRVLGEIGASSDRRTGIGMTGALASAPTPVGSRQTRTNNSSHLDEGLEAAIALSRDPPIEITRIIDRNGASTGLVWADLPHPQRHQVDAAFANLTDDRLMGADLTQPELLRLRFAVAGIKRDLTDGQKRSWILPISSAAILSRGRRKLLLESLRSLQPLFQARLRGLIANVAHGPPVGDLAPWFDRLGPLLQDIGVLWCAPVALSPTHIRPPCALLAIDLQADPPPSTQAAVPLLGMARRLSLPVLVRTANRVELKRWSDLGATLFAITQTGP